MEEEEQVRDVLLATLDCLLLQALNEQAERLKVVRLRPLKPGVAVFMIVSAAQNGGLTAGAVAIGEGGKAPPM